MWIDSIAWNFASDTSFQFARMKRGTLVILNTLQRVKLSRVAGVRAPRRNPERSEGTLFAKRLRVPSPSASSGSGFRQQALASPTPARRLNFALRAQNDSALKFFPIQRNCRNWQSEAFVSSLCNRQFWQSWQLWQFFFRLPSGHRFSLSYWSHRAGW